jgi:predicted HNH restriction endonuclease
MVHHIDHDRTNNNIENLKTVCAKCHKLYHKHEAWNKSMKMEPLSPKHKKKISIALRSYHAKN